MAGRAIGRVLPSKGLRPYPEQLGPWPAAAGLLTFTWIELASGWGEDPALLVTAALGYTVLTLVAQVVWGVETSPTTARALYGGDARVAVRSQYWMLAVMVGFTTLALWLLAQAGR